MPIPCVLNLGDSSVDTGLLTGELQAVITVVWKPRRVFRERTALWCLRCTLIYWAGRLLWFAEFKSSGSGMKLVFFEPYAGLWHSSRLIFVRDDL